MLCCRCRNQQTRMWEWCRLSISLFFSGSSLLPTNFPYSGLLVPVGFFFTMMSSNVEDFPATGIFFVHSSPACYGSLYDTLVSRCSSFLCVDSIFLVSLAVIQLSASSPPKRFVDSQPTSVRELANSMRFPFINSVLRGFRSYPDPHLSFLVHSSCPYCRRVIDLCLCLCAFAFSFCFLFYVGY